MAGARRTVDFLEAVEGAAPPERGGDADGGQEFLIHLMGLLQVLKGMLEKRAGQLEAQTQTESQRQRKRSAYEAGLDESDEGPAALGSGDSVPRFVGLLRQGKGKSNCQGWGERPAGADEADTVAATGGPLAGGECDNECTVSQSQRPAA